MQVRVGQFTFVIAQIALQCPLQHRLKLGWPPRALKWVRLRAPIMPLIPASWDTRVRRARWIARNRHGSAVIVVRAQDSVEIWRVRAEDKTARIDENVIQPPIDDRRGEAIAEVCAPCRARPPSCRGSCHDVFLAIELMQEDTGQARVVVGMTVAKLLVEHLKDRTWGW